VGYKGKGEMDPGFLPIRAIRVDSVGPKFQFLTNRLMTSVNHS